MSQPRETDGEEQTMKKKITIVCYTGEDGTSPRSWVDEQSAHNFFEEEEVVSRSYKLAAGDEFVTLDEDEYEEFRGRDLGEAELIAEETSKTEFAKDLWEFSDRIRSEAFRNNPNVDLGEVADWYNDRIATRDGSIFEDTILRMNTEVEYTEMLVHPSEMEPGNVVDEDEPEQVAVKIDFRLRYLTSDEIEYMDENVLKPAVDYLATHELFDRVRWTNCERRTVEEMVCFNI